MSAAEDINADEFLRGQQACIDGEECPEGASESFERGYGAQYEIEQVQTYLSEHGYHVHTGGRRERSS